MKKNTKDLTLQRMLDIKDGKPMPHTTEKSEFNQAAEANRPKITSCWMSTPRGKMLTQQQMGILRRWEQIWTKYPLGFFANQIRSK